MPNFSNTETTRVLIVGGSLHSLGGVERYCQRLVAAMQQYSDVGVYWYPSNSAFPCANESVAYLRLLRTTCQQISAALAEFDPVRDVVWMQYGNAVDLLILQWIRRRFSGRVICTVHAGEQWTHLRHRLLRRASGRALRVADQVCVLSSAQEALIGEMGIASVRIPTLLPAWINRLDEVRRIQPAREGVLYFGRLAAEKGIEDLLRAFHGVARRRPSARLHIAGSGPEDERWKRLCSTLQLNGVVTWHGLLGENELQALAQRCRLLVYPSYADAYPLSVLEGFAAGLQVIAYEIPGTREMLAEFGGIGVPLGRVDVLTSAIDQVLKAPTNDEGRPGAAVRLQWENVVNEYLRVVCGDTASRRPIASFSS